MVKVVLRYFLQAYSGLLEGVSEGFERHFIEMKEFLELFNLVEVFLKDFLLCCNVL